MSREAQSSRLSLVFEPGHRPSADDVRRLLQLQDSEVAVSQPPRPAAGGLTLRAAGLAFELSGLAPAAAAKLPDIAHWYGFPAGPAMPPGEAICLSAGEHARHDHVLSQVRAMAGAARRLADLAHVSAVVWQPARSAMAPAAFITAIASWLHGGPFPALGLTALYRDDAGAIRSEGLAHFTGQELHIEPELGITTAQDAKIAARMINHLVGRDPIKKPFDTLGPNGEQLSVAPPGSDGFLRIWRKS